MPSSVVAVKFVRFTLLFKLGFESVDVFRGGYRFDPETQCYAVTIYMCDDTELPQSTAKLAEAEKWLKLIDKAIGEGAVLRAEIRATCGDDDDD